MKLKTLHYVEIELTNGHWECLETQFLPEVFNGDLVVWTEGIADGTLYMAGEWKMFCVGSEVEFGEVSR